MSRIQLKRLIYITLTIFVFILSYKIYLIGHENNFREKNFTNIKKIENSAPKELYSFAVIGSSENSIDIFQNKIIKSINSDKDILFTVSTGDAVMDGAEYKYQILNNSLKLLNTPAVIGIGKAELSDGGDRRYYKHFGSFYFSFYYGNSYFIFIDTTGMTPFDMQKDWVSDELTTADKYKQKFVLMYDSPLKNRDKDSAGKKDFKEFLIDALASHKVDGVFTNGASYETAKENNVDYFSGGGAGGLNLSDSSGYYYLKVNVYDNGINVDKVEIPSASSHGILKTVENIWVYIHAVFYAQLTNLLLIIFLILLVFLLLYRKVSKEVNYYRDFSGSSDSVDVNKKLNIAMFTNNYLPFVGGVPISIARLAEALRKRGNNVVIFAPDYPGADDRDDNVFRCELFYYKESDNFNFPITNIYSSQINHKFLEGNFDIVHVHHPFWLGKKGLKLGKKINVPVILTYHTRLEMYAQNLPVFKMTFKNILSHKLIKNFAQKCDGVIAPTESASEYLTNVGVSRQKLVLPTGIDLSVYDRVNENDIENIKNRYAPNGEILLCTVSRLAIEKNINFLIEGLKYVKENTKKKFKCIIIGDGPEKNNLQNLIDKYSLNDEIYLIGSVEQKEVAKYYMASDLFVFGSKSETQGMVLLEAMAGKCPVLCIRSSGTDDVVRDEYNGFKTSDNLQEWSERIIYLLENEELLRTMGTNAFRYSQKFSIDKMSQKVEMFYKKLILLKGNRLEENMND